MAKPSVSGDVHVVSAARRRWPRPPAAREYTPSTCGRPSCGGAGARPGPLGRESADFSLCCASERSPGPLGRAGRSLSDHRHPKGDPNRGIRNKHTFRWLTSDLNMILIRFLSVGSPFSDPPLGDTDLNYFMLIVNPVGSYCVDRPW